MLGGLHIEIAILKMCECVCIILSIKCDDTHSVCMHRYFEVGQMAVDGLMILCRVTLQALVQQIHLSM